MMLGAQNIGGRDVFVVQNHAEALFYWAQVRRLASPPILISLDHHTDAHPAFLRATHRGFDDDSQRQSREEAEHLVRQIDFNSDESVRRAVGMLKNDEHIDAAIRADILSYAFVVHHNSQNTPSIEERAYAEAMCMEKILERKIRREPDPVLPSRPHHYNVPENRIFLRRVLCAPDCTKRPHDDDCQKPHFDQALEAKYLDAQLTVLGEMGEAVGITSLQDTPYILDIDLDYLKTGKAANPTSPETFHTLIRKSLAVTIALEPVFVEELRLDGETITSESLLADILKRVTDAMNP